MGKRILILYISDNSGHHRASLAVEQALKIIDGAVQTRCVNSFSFTNPVLEKIIHRTYMAVIKKRPEVWEYLYDNPDIVRKTKRLKEAIHRHNSVKMMSLLDDFKPDAVVCTQAFPCGIIADIKKTSGLPMPLIGILTDYAPHSYWIYNDVDAYVVPSKETGERLIQNGVPSDKIKPFGIPVDPKFYTPGSREDIAARYHIDPAKPTLLIMGGGGGLGPIRNIVSLLGKSSLDIQIITATGTNKRLYNLLLKIKGSLGKKIVVLPYAENINELMDISFAIMTKPGGITTAEAMAKNLPIIIVNPLPGQEAMNTRFLLEHSLAVKANDEDEAVRLLEDMLRDQNRISLMKNRMKEHTQAEPSFTIARFILEMAS